MLGFGAATAAIGAASYAVKTSVQEFARFQTQAYQVGNITSATSEQIAGFSHQILQLPPALGNSTDLMKGMYQAISAGIPKDNALEFIVQNAKAAKGNLAEMATTVKGSAAIMNAYNLDVSQTTDVLDAMVRTVDLGVLNFSELSENIGKGMSVAKAAGISYEELLSGLAALTRGGLSVEEAMTALRNISLAVIKPQEEATKTAAALGIELNRSAIQSKGFVNWMTELGEKVGDSETAITSLFGNIRGLNGALQFTSESGGQMLVDIFDQMNDRAGRTEENFDRVSTSLAERWSQMTAAIHKSAVMFGETVEPILSGVLKGVTNLITAWNELNEAMRVGSSNQTYVADTENAEAALTALAASFRDVAQAREEMSYFHITAGELASGAADIPSLPQYQDQAEVLQQMQERLSTLLKLSTAQREGRELTAQEMREMEEYAPAVERYNELLGRQAAIRSQAAEVSQQAAGQTVKAERETTRATAEAVDQRLKAHENAMKEREEQEKKAAKAAEKLREQELTAFSKRMELFSRESAVMLDTMAEETFDLSKIGLKSDILVTDLTDDFETIKTELTADMFDIGLRGQETGDVLLDSFATAFSGALADGRIMYTGVDSTLQALADSAGVSAEEMRKQLNEKGFKPAADDAEDSAKKIAGAIETLAGGMSSSLTGAMDDFFTATLTGRFDEYEGILTNLFEGIGATAGQAMTDSITDALFGEGGMQGWFEEEFAKLKIFGGEGGAFQGLSGGQGAMMGLAGAGMVYGATQQQSRGAGMAQGAMGGAMAGAAFGPVGMVIGAIVGAIAGGALSGGKDPSSMVGIGPGGGWLFTHGQDMSKEERGRWVQQTSLAYRTMAGGYRDYAESLALAMGDSELFGLVGGAPVFDSRAYLGKLPDDYVDTTGLGDIMGGPWEPVAPPETEPDTGLPPIGGDRRDPLLPSDEPPGTSRGMTDDERGGEVWQLIDKPGAGGGGGYTAYMQMTAAEAAQWLLDTWMPAAFEEQYSGVTSEVFSRLGVSEAMQTRLAKSLEILPGADRLEALQAYFETLIGLTEMVSGLDPDAMRAESAKTQWEAFFESQEKGLRKIEVFAAGWEQLDILQQQQQADKILTTIQEARELELQMLGQIRQVSEQLTAEIAGDIEGLRLGGMSEQERVQYLGTQVQSIFEDLRDAIASGASATDIAGMTERARSYIQQLGGAFGDLGGEQGLDALLTRYPQLFSSAIAAFPGLTPSGAMGAAGATTGRDLLIQLYEQLQGLQSEALQTSEDQVLDYASQYQAWAEATMGALQSYTGGTLDASAATQSIADAIVKTDEQLVKLAGSASTTAFALGGLTSVIMALTKAGTGVGIGTGPEKSTTIIMPPSGSSGYQTALY